MCLTLLSFPRRLLAAFFALLFAAPLIAEPLPGQLSGSWHITRVLPTSNTACWDKGQAAPLVGSTLSYRANAMRWRGGAVPLEDITTRHVTDADFRKENSGSSFAELGIHSRSVLEVDFQHEDADITGATTEVPGDSVLLAGPNRIVISACGVYFEATRAATSLRPASFRH